MNASFIFIRPQTRDVNRVLSYFPDGKSYRRVPRDLWKETDLGVTYLESWTILRDPSLVLPGEREACKEVSSGLGVEVVRAIRETVSGTYCFGQYREGSLINEIEVSEGRVLRKVGCEAIQNVHVEDILSLMETAGVPSEGISDCHHEDEHFEWPGDIEEDLLGQLSDLLSKYDP